MLTHNDTDMTKTATTSSVICEIPIDLFISRKKRPSLRRRGDLTFTDASGNLIFSLHDSKDPSFKSTISKKRCSSSSSSSSSSSFVLNLIDAKGNFLFSISRNHDGWQGCRGDSKDLTFKMKKTCQSFHRTEVEVFLNGESAGDFISSLKIRGCPFQRSCTIYQGNSIVAQTSLMYKLRTIIVRRRRFRLTIFPGVIEHALLVALIVVFFNTSI